MIASLMVLAAVDYAGSRDIQWPEFGGDLAGTGFSQARQINTSNVHKLKQAWVYHTGDQQGNTPIQCTPLVVDGTMYLVTAGHRVVALDPATGKPNWAFDSKIDSSRSGHTRSSRGVAFARFGWGSGVQRRIFYGTPDGRILSIDATKGTLDPEFKTVDLRHELGTKGYVGISSAPTVYGDLVFVGIASDEGRGAAPGHIIAFSARTGKRKWSFEVLSKDQLERGIGAAGAWNGYVVDQKHGVLFATTGSAAPDFDGRDRPGDNLFANCVLALDARTGKKLWHYQTVHHDLWDHDNASRPLLCQIKRDGKLVEVVAVLTKTGFCFVLDRKTGKPVFGVKEVPVPPSTMPGEMASKTQPEPILPPALAPTLFDLSQVTNISAASRDSVLKLISGLSYGEKYLPPTSEGTVVSPGYWGGSPWSGGSFDPRTNTLFANTNNLPGIMSTPANYRMLVDHEGYPGSKPPWGMLTAIDLNSGKFRWQKPLGEYKELTLRKIPQTGTPNLGGTLTTAGNLVFVGATCDQMLRAFDSRTGKILLQHPLPASAFAAPMTYEINGHQYIVVAASGGGFGKQFGFDRGPISDSFVCLSLPKS